MAVNVNAPTWVDWDVRDNLPPSQRDGFTATEQAFDTLVHVITVTIPQFWADMDGIL